jgi:superfamily I DNA and/or RNA helicase
MTEIKNLLFVEESDGFSYRITSRKKNAVQKQMEFKLKSSDAMDNDEAFGIFDIKQMSTANRWRLYRFWRQLFCHEKELEIELLNKQYSDYVKKYNRLRVEEDLCAMNECDIIGVTTTGAAKYRTIIEQIDPMIVVVEEAAEVLESHVVTSLTKSTKHLILIGDHQQLKPNPTVYDLAINYNLEVSLFERMIKNGLPYHQLKVQHRMRPCISSLLVPHIYKELIDHESVHKYEEIKGIH